MSTSSKAKDVAEKYKDVLPRDFLWGYSSASYQIEGGHDKGGRGLSVWDVALRDAPLGNGNDACNSFERWRDDVELLKSYGVSAYRFSISWSRVIPKGGKDDPVNEQGIKYYNDLIDALVEAGIAPIVTLFHWDTPLALQERYGGFLAKSEVKERLLEDFENYAALCFRSYGDRVKHWITHNEPMVFSALCLAAIHKDTTSMETDRWVLGHNLVLTHARAVARYRKEFGDQKGIIGITNAIEWVEPYDDSAEAASATQRALDVTAGYFIDPIYLGRDNEGVKALAGDAYCEFTKEEWAIIKGSADYFGVNNYSTRWATGKIPSNPPRFEAIFGGVETVQERDGKPIGNRGHNGHPYDVPWGFYKLLHHIKKTWAQDMPIYITENGFAVADEAKLTMEDIVNDTQRQDFYAGYISSMCQAVVDGVDVKGYFAWSLLDNLEWVMGYEPRFGVTHVDRENGFKRTPKGSTTMLKDLFAQIQK